MRRSSDPASGATSSRISGAAIAGGVAAAVALSCGPGSGTSGSTFTQLTFYRHGTDEILDAATFSAYPGAFFGASELATVPDRPLETGSGKPGVDVVLQSGSDRVEAHLFARDPSEMKATMISLDALLNADSAIYEQQTDLRENLPNSVVVGRVSPDHATRVTLEPEHFFQGDSPGAFVMPPAKGSVKAAFVFNRGACSFEQPADELHEAVSEGVWMGFLAQFNKGSVNGQPICSGDGRATRIYSRTVTYLEHTPGDDSDRKGGFFLNFFYHIDTSLIFVDDVDIRFMSHYRWTLEDGVLTVVPAVDHGTVHGPLSDETVEDVSAALVNDLPGKVRDQAERMQTQDVLGADHRVQCEKRLDCDLAQSLLEIAIENGASTAEALGIEQFSASDVHAMKVAIGHGDLGRNWRCRPDDDSQPGRGRHCELLVRARRINVFANAVELVWFDGKDVDNPAYALWVAAHQNTSANANQTPTFDQAAVDKLCAARPTSKMSFRSYTRTALPPAFSTDDCVQVNATGGGGCAVHAGGSRGHAVAGLVLLALTGLIGRRRSPTRRR